MVHRHGVISGYRSDPWHEVFGIFAALLSTALPRGENLLATSRSLAGQSPPRALSGPT